MYVENNVISVITLCALFCTTTSTFNCDTNSTNRAAEKGPNIKYY